MTEMLQKRNCLSELKARHECLCMQPPSLSCLGGRVLLASSSLTKRSLLPKGREYALQELQAISSSQMALNATRIILLLQIK